MRSNFTRKPAQVLMMMIWWFVTTSLEARRQKQISSSMKWKKKSTTWICKAFFPLNHMSTMPTIEKGDFTNLALVAQAYLTSYFCHRHVMCKSQIWLRKKISCRVFFSSLLSTSSYKIRKRFEVQPIFTMFDFLDYGWSFFVSWLSIEMKVLHFTSSAD